MQGNLLTISVIVPAYNAESTLLRCLAPLLAMRSLGEVHEILVVDDGSTDATATLAAAIGLQVMESGGRLGPGAARNAAVRQARGNVVWFVDADAVVHEDAARILIETLSDPTVCAVFGAYDDRPGHAGFWSQYKNLVHHHYHRSSGRFAQTFWAGCGAIRRSVFLEVGGFDASRFAEPSIEDIELGCRLRECGHRILLVPEIQATHLKVWEFGNLIRTELFQRALPWARLIHSRTGWPNSLNVSRAERARAALALALLASVLLAPALGWAPVAGLVVAVAANFRLARLFWRRNGLRFACAALLFHQIYYLYCAAAVGWTWLERVWRPRATDAKPMAAVTAASWAVAADE